MKLFSVRRLLRKQEPLGPLPTDKQAFLTMFRIAWPSVCESLLVQLTALIDTMMVGTLGSYAIASVGLTTQPKFVFLCLFISLNVAVSALVARRKGQNNQQSANMVLRQALLITLILALLFSVICVLFAPQIIALAGAKDDTLPHAVAYYRIIMGCMIFNVISLVINAAQRGVGNTKIAMRTNLTSNLINLVFNYLLINGIGFFPKLGIRGAAIATVLGTVVAFFMSIYSVSKKDGYLYLKDFWKIRFERSNLTPLWHVASGTLADQIFLRIGFLLFSIVVANLGTAAFATHQIGMNILSISFALGDGLSVACVTLVGQNLGAQRRDLACMYGNMCHTLGLLFAAGLSCVYLLFSKQIIMLFSKEPQIVEAGVQILYFIIVIIFLQITQVVFSGSLRGAGDVKFVALVSLISVAFVRPLAGWLFCYPMGLGLVGAWIGLSVDQLIRSSMTYFRFKRGKWMYMKI